MTPSLLILIAALLGFAATMFRSGADGSRWAACAVSVLLLGIGLGLWWQTAPAGEIDTVVSAPAQFVSGEPVTSVVTLENDLGVRRTHRVTLSQAVPGGAAALIGMLFLGLIGLVLTGRGGDPVEGPVLGRRVCVGGLVGSAIALSIFYSGRQQTSGEAGMRQFLDGFDVGQLQFFSVPDASWTYISGAVLPLALGTTAILVATLASLVKGRESIARWGVPLAAILGAAACIWQSLSVDGVPWRALEGGLWSTALLLGIAAFLRHCPARTGVLTALAVVVAALGPIG